MAATQGTVALLDRSLNHGVVQKASCAQHYAKGIPMLVSPSRRACNGVIVSSTGNQANLGRGASVKAYAVATAPAPGLSKSVGGYYPSHDSLERTMIAPSWAVLTEEISIGPCPRSPRDLESLMKNTNISAILFLETVEGCKKIGMDWNNFREKASQQGVVAVRIPMQDHDQQDQASTLPEAVRAAAVLVALGYKVHVTCTSGVYRSPLVALGYLTFVKGMEFSQAVRLISSHNPAAQPNFDSWEEAKTKISAGEMRRVAQLADAVGQKRLKANRTGVPADDWLVAQRLLVAEAFERGISTDVNLSDAIAQAATIKATKSVVEELAIAKAEADKAKNLAVSSKERLEFFSRHLQSVKEKEESARKTAVAAVKDKEALSRQVETLKVKEEEASRGAEVARGQVASLSAKVAELERQETALKASADSAITKAKELQVEMNALAQREAAAKKELINANAKLQTLSAKYAVMEASLSEARASKDHASDRLKEVATQIQSVKSQRLDTEELSELTKKEAAANFALVSAQERLAFSERQMLALKEKEQTARQAVKVADEEARKMSVRMEELSLREAAALEATRAANDQVAALKQQLVELEKRLAVAKEGKVPSQAVLGTKVMDTATVQTGGAATDLERELLLSKKREAQARDAATAANDRIAFFNRHMELMKKREGKAAMAVEQRIKAFTEQAAELRAKLAEADAAAAEQEKKIEGLSLQVTELQQKELAAQESARVAGERIEFFHRHMELLKQKESAAKQAAVQASEKAKVLLGKVNDLERREILALSQADKLSQKVTSLLEINSDLGAELAEVKEREARLAKALDDGNGMLQVALEADEALKQLRQEAEKAAKELLESRLRADKLAADLERELISAGKKPKHYNDIEKVPSSEIEQQLVAQIATMQQSMTASGGGTAVATLAAEPESQLTILRNLVLGALGVAAVPVTLMSVFSSSPSPNMIGSVVNTESESANQLLVKPIIQPASAEDFCRQVPSGSRSARAERFCNSLADIAID